MRSVLCAMLIAGSVIGTATSGLAQSSQDMLRQLLPQLADDGKYKRDDPWWSRNFQGFDFLEPLIPRVAASRGDVGNIVLDSGVPYSLLTTAFAARSTDQATLTGIGRWGWVGIDERQDNWPVLAGLFALAGAGVFLPSTQDGGQYFGDVKIDPGERVMRPDYGCGLLDLVFAPNSPELASALTLSVQAGNVPKHMHPNANEMQYILEGTGTIWLGDKEVKVKPGDLVIIPKGTAHGGTKPDGSTAIKAIAIKTPPQAPDDMKLLN